MFDCLLPPIDNDRSLSRAECSGLQPKVIICIERLFNGGRYSKQSLLFHYFFFKGKKIHASYCELFSVSRDV